jgi:hypothetical protein
LKGYVNYGYGKALVPVDKVKTIFNSIQECVDKATENWSASKFCGINWMDENHPQYPKWCFISKRCAGLKIDEHAYAFTKPSQKVSVLNVDKIWTDGLKIGSKCFKCWPSCSYDKLALP